jgi:hypothetical protein
MASEMTMVRDDGEIVPVGNRGMSRGDEAKSLTAAMSSAAIEEIRAAFTMARQFPRDEDLARQKVIKICKSPVFVANHKAMYKFKIGATWVTGLSINVAKEMARSMGNMRYGYYVIHDTPDSRTIRAWAFDMESNTKNEIDDSFSKTVWRRNKDENGRAAEGGYYKPVDDRELLMLTNLKGSKAIRNCLLNLMPFEMKEVAADTIEKTIESRATSDPASFLRELKDEFGDYNIEPAELRDYCQSFGQDLERLTPKWLTHLKTVAAGLSEGSSWNDYLTKAAEKKGITGPITSASDLASKIAAKAAQVTTPTKKEEAPVKTEEQPVKKESPVETKQEVNEDADESPPMDQQRSSAPPATRKRGKPDSGSADVSDGIV